MDKIFLAILVFIYVIFIVELTLREECGDSLIKLGLGRIDKRRIKLWLKGRLNEKSLEKMISLKHKELDNLRNNANDYRREIIIDQIEELKELLNSLGNSISKSN